MRGCSGKQCSHHSSRGFLLLAPIQVDFSEDFSARSQSKILRKFSVGSLLLLQNRNRPSGKDSIIQTERSWPADIRGRWQKTQTAGISDLFLWANDIRGAYCAIGLHIKWILLYSDVLASMNKTLLIARLCFTNDPAWKCGLAKRKKNREKQPKVVCFLMLSLFSSPVFLLG